MTFARCAVALLATCLTAPAFAQPAPSSDPRPPLDSARYDALDGRAKRDLLWSAISAEPYRGRLPRGGVWSATKLIWGRLTLERTFVDDADVGPKRKKVFHQYGTTAQVRFVPERRGMIDRLGQTCEAENAAPYTGVFATGAVGVARLSLGLGDVGMLWAPGIGLKLFVDGKPSVNVHAIPKDGGQESKDFFAATLSTKIDPTPLDGFLRRATGANPTHRTTDHVAAIEADGTPVAEPCSPFHVEFRPPAQIPFSATPRWGVEDFRRSVAKVPVGTTLYEVWASRTEGAEPERIGAVVTESPFVASAFQDERLHFKHVR